ncbi:head GIN domain-containing protein [Hymenobacter edaphi]|nr:head GIN domain-containing protein [Hymenobacter edaphi]
MNRCKTGAQDSTRRRLGAYAAPALLVAAVLLGGCRKDHEGDCFKSSGKVTEERRELAPFRVLRLYDNVEVTVVQDAETYALVRTGQNLQEDLELTEQDGTLTIRNTSRCNWVRRYDVPRQVTLHTPRLTDVFHTGEKTLRTQGTFRQDTLFLHLARAGDVEFDVDSKRLWVDLYELGDMRLSGRTDELVATVGDLGSLYAQGLRARRASVDLDKLGDGDAHVLATDFLGARVAGNGSLYYNGSAAQKDISVTGKGRAVRQ